MGTAAGLARARTCASWRNDTNYALVTAICLRVCPTKQVRDEVSARPAAQR